MLRGGKHCSGSPGDRQGAAEGTVQLGSGKYGLTLGTSRWPKSLTIRRAARARRRSTGPRTFQAAPSTRILRVDAGAQVTINDVTFTDGSDGRDENCRSGATLNLNGGGAIFNARGDLELKDVAFADNPAALWAARSRTTAPWTCRTYPSPTIKERLAVRSSARTGDRDGVSFEGDATGATDEAAVYLAVSGTATFENTTVVGSGGVFEPGRRHPQRRRDPHADQRHSGKQHPRLLETDQGPASTSVANTSSPTAFPMGTATRGATCPTTMEQPPPRSPRTSEATSIRTTAVA